jgi:uncharacterized membrane protein
LNLIRVIPAKGQDISMATSIFLAKLIGPILAVIGIGMLVNGKVYRALVEEFLRSHALIYLSGLLTMTAGLALVLSHNVWAADWRVIITILGWLGTIGGAARIALPQQVEAIGRNIVKQPMTLTVGGIAVLALGALLCAVGYFR